MDTHNYQEIRQVVNDALSPIKDQLDRIYDSLQNEFVRKDALDPVIKNIKDSLQEEKRERENIESRMIGAPQRILLYVVSLVGLALSLLGLINHLKP